MYFFRVMFIASMLLVGLAHADELDDIEISFREQPGSSTALWSVLCPSRCNILRLNSFSPAHWKWDLPQIS